MSRPHAFFAMENTLARSRPEDWHAQAHSTSMHSVRRALDSIGCPSYEVEFGSHGVQFARIALLFGARRAMGRLLRRTPRERFRESARPDAQPHRAVSSQSCVDQLA